MYQHCSVLFRVFVCKHLESASDVGHFRGGRSQQVGSIAFTVISPRRSRLAASQVATNHLLLAKTVLRVF